MQRILTLLSLLTLGLSTQAQQLNPSDYIYPIREVDGTYSANFGEMRPGHFHGGVDIRTGGVEGKPLVAMADGFISRITINAGGYGRAIYLTHTNGTTAVYGHLQRFRNDIETAVRTARTQRQSNQLDQYYTPEQWPVRQGDVVGYSGNSGSSAGPHLHFELRDTPSQRLYNPVRERIIRPQDTFSPRIMRLHYVEVDTIQHDNLCRHSVPKSYAVVRQSEGQYRLTREEPLSAGRKGYFIAEVSDRRNGVNNTFGIWRITAFVDGERYFEYRMDGFTQDLSRCCDAVSYYPLQVGSRNEVIRLAQLEKAPDCFYPTMLERGLVRTSSGQVRHIRIEAEDDCGNCSELKFDIRGTAETFLAEADSSAILLHADEAASVALKNELSAHIPAEALYESLYCRPERLPTPKADSGIVVLSPAYRIFSSSTPLRHGATISIRTEVPAALQLRASLAVRTARGGMAYVGGTYDNGVVTATTRTTGELFVVADTLPPRIRPQFAPKANLSQAKNLDFHISDNFSGIVSYTLRIDGQWVPCDYYPMKGRLTHVFSTPATQRNHLIELYIRDSSGNTTFWKSTFYR